MEGGAGGFGAGDGLPERGDGLNPHVGALVLQPTQETVERLLVCGVPPQPDRCGLPHISVLVRGGHQQGPHRQHGPLSVLPGRPHLLHLGQHPHGQREHRPPDRFRCPVQLQQPPQKGRHVLLPQPPCHQQQHLVPGGLLRPLREQRDQFLPLPLLFLPPPQQIQRRQVLHEGPVHEAVEAASVVGKQEVPGAQVIDQFLRRRHGHRGADIGLHQEVADDVDQVVVVDEGPGR